MSRRDRIYTRLNELFHPALLEVIDDSAKHAGHAGAKPEGQTHYTVIIESHQFTGQNRVQRQREIMAALQVEFETGLHALSIKASVPSDTTSD